MKDFIKQYHKTNLLILLLISSTFLAKANIFTLTIKEELPDCKQISSKTWYLVKYSNSKDWENFYGNIDGFKYETGYRYILKVKRTKKENNTKNRVTYNYNLFKIVKKIKVTSLENKALNFMTKYKWKLIQLQGKTIENTTAFLLFNAQKNQITGNAGCNILKGSFKMDEQNISFNQLALTRMACNQEFNKLESSFLEILGIKDLRYDIADQTLNLYHKDKLAMMFGLSPLPTQQ